MTCEECAGHGWTVADARIVVCDCGTYDPPKWVVRGDTACVLTHSKDPERPRRAHVGYACTGHHARLEQLIAELPALFDDLGLALTASENPNSDRVQSSREPGLSLNRAVVDARDEIHAELVRFVRYVAEARCMHYPADTVSALATWLLESVDWLCEQPDINDTYTYLSRVTSEGKRLAYPNGRRKFVVPGVTCGAPVRCDVPSQMVVRCEGALTAFLTPGDDFEFPSELVCDTCGLGIPSMQWLSWAEGRRKAS